MDYKQSKLEVEMGPILKFFLERDAEELERMADGLSDEAHEFFSTTLSTLLGTMPDEFADVIVTTHKSALKQMLQSAMVTGYMTKVVEDRVQLERLLNNDKPDETGTDSSSMFDHLVPKPKFS